MFHHQANQGKGAAIRTAIQQMRGQYAIIQDTDLDYDPNDCRILLESLLTDLSGPKTPLSYRWALYRKHHYMPFARQKAGDVSQKH